MVARLRALGYPVGYYENVEGGHGAATDNAQRAFNWALIYEFLWEKIGD
jgi:prolyl oligopeptidase